MRAEGERSTHEHLWEPSEVVVSTWVVAGAEPIRMEDAPLDH